MRVAKYLLCLLVLFGCGGDSPTAPTTVQPTTVVTTTPPVPVYAPTEVYLERHAGSHDNILVRFRSDEQLTMRLWSTSDGELLKIPCPPGHEMREHLATVKCRRWDVEVTAEMLSGKFLVAQAKLTVPICPRY